MTASVIPRSRPAPRRPTRSLLLLLGLTAIAVASPASAQWTRVNEVPIADIFSVWTDGSTIVAGSDSTAFLSTDGGATWIPTGTVATGVTAVEAVRVHNGRLYAGTHGQGVFTSSDLGATWQDFNQGLVGGFANSQLVIKDLLVRRDSLYAATEGAGAWIQNLAAPGTWSHYGDFIDRAQASNMEGIAGSPTRLLGCGGFNGDVFLRDPDDVDWTESLLFNDRLAAGLAPLSAVWTGRSWLVGTNIGVFHSSLGQSPWTYFDFGLRPTLFASFALAGDIVFTHFASGEGTGIEYSTDDGVTWHVLDAQPGTFTYEIAILGDDLYAGRVDGLWRRSIASIVGAPGPDAGPSTSLHFAILGPRLRQDEVHFRFQLPRAGRVRIDLFDVSGRRVSAAVDQTLPAGPNDVNWSAGHLASGIYLARLSTAARSETAKLVRIR
jgi:photosystem II stability/assembly factor-like uncharacterized protein